MSPSHRPPDADLAPETAGLSERYRALLERTPAAVYARVEIGGRRTTYRSSRIEPILGYPAASLDRAAWLSLIDDDDRDRVLMAEGRADSTKDPFAEEYRMRAADGRTVWIRDEAEWVPGVAGEPAHWLGVLADVTERHELRRELREATGRFRTLIEQLPAVTYLDLPGEAMTDVHVSSQLRELFGVAEDGAELGEWPERVHAEDRERATKESLLAARSGEPGPIEYRMVRRDGEVVWIREVATVIRDDEGEPRAVQGVLLDVTAQKTLEQELRETAARFRTLVEQIPAVVYVDPLGPEPSAPRYVSPYVETMFGITPGEATGDPEWWTGRLHPEDRDEAIRTAREASARGGPYRNDYRIVRPSGEVVWVRDEAVAVRDDAGRPRFWQGVMYDITDRKRAEQDLRQALALERDAVERLREADELKDTFLTAVSHDLRTPLSTILGIAVTLEHEDEVPLDPADRRALLQSLNAKARELTDLVTDLLDLDRLRRGVTEAQLRVEALHELVAAQARAADLGDDHPLTLDLEPVSIACDRTMVGRIVENLLANAGRHTPAGTRVWVRLSGDAEGGALLVVEDDGPGVPAALRETLFTPFERGPSANPQSPGSGVGLSLVARFAELHGGRAWVEDRAGGGASFRVWLPGAAAVS